MAVILPTCKQCGKNHFVEVCPACKGKLSGMFGKLTCSKCGSTGYVCPRHGKNWK
jgi:hypothetical protein